MDDFSGKEKPLCIFGASVEIRCIEVASNACLQGVAVKSIE
jgi:hypothetical protein